MSTSILRLARCIAWLTAASIHALGAQRPILATPVRAYVAIDTAIVALTHVRIIDGTGAPARNDQTLIIRDGKIAEVGDAARLTPPAGAQILDLAGSSVIPGLVMVHEH